MKIYCAMCGRVAAFGRPRAVDIGQIDAFDYETQPVNVGFSPKDTKQAYVCARCVRAANATFATAARNASKPPPKRYA